MTDLQIFYADWGVLSVFLVCFAEFVGFPVAAVPFLLFAGTLAPTAGGTFWAIPVAATAGAFLADFLWYHMGKKNSRAVFDRACGLTSNPWACITFVRRRAREAGALKMIVSKFVPATSNLVAAAAGLDSVPARRFLPLNLAAIALWSTFWPGVAWLASGQTARFLPLLEAYLRYVVAGVIGIIVLAGLWRVHKTRLHKGLHVRDGRAR